MGTLTKKVKITIDNNNYKDFNFLNIVLSQQLMTPNQLRFTMQKKDFKDCMGEGYFPTYKEIIGKEVVCEIETTRFDNSDEQQSEKIKFNGVIFNVNIRSSAGTFSEQLIDVTANSHDYLLMDHPHCFSYEGKKLKDIVTATLAHLNISIEGIDPRTTESIPYTVQYNESNHQFLSRLAKRYGEWMYNDGEKWIFGKIKKKNEDDPILLEERNDVLNYSFQAGITHHKLKHAHHDYLKYENSTKSDSDYPHKMSSTHFLTKEAKDRSIKLFTKETFQHLQCSTPEGNTIKELDVSVETQLFSEKTQQTVCIGSSVRADLSIGSFIQLKDHWFKDDNDSNFSILYESMMITGIVHYTEANGGYRNSFTAVADDSNYPPYYQCDTFPHSAAQRAKVMDNNDPENLGRIRVQFLWQEGQDDNLMTPWIRIAQPHGGDQKGFYFIPEIDEEVMVDFENGNAEKPYVVGTLWHGKQRPKDSWTGKEKRTNTWGQSSGAVTNNSLKGIRTRNGHAIAFFDDPVTNKGQIVIVDSNDNYLRLRATDNQIEIYSHGNIKLFAENDIIIEANNDIIQKAGHNRLSTIAGADNVSSGSHYYKAGGAIHMEGKSFFAQGEDKAVLDSPSLVQMQSDATANVLGNGSVFIGSGGAMEVSAGSTLKVEAQATMDINAGAPMILDAPIVNIN